MLSTKAKASVLFLLGAATVLAAATILYLVLTHDDQRGEDFYTVDLGTTPVGLDPLVAERLRAIGEPLGGEAFASFIEAEARAGYRIPRPSSEFSLRDGLTHLETFWQPSSEVAPVSRSRYLTVGGLAITLEIVPSTYDVTDSRSKGTPTTIGSKLGWMLESTPPFFAWKCGAAATGTELYCTVLADKEVTRADFDNFVASVQ